MRSRIPGTLTGHQTVFWRPARLAHGRGDPAVTEEGQMSWVWALGAVWLVLGPLIGVLIGRGIRLADRKQAEALAAETADPNVVVDPAALLLEPVPLQRVRGDTDRP
jgi:hypothetical protein